MAKVQHSDDVMATADKLVQLFGISEKKAKRISKTFGYGDIEELQEKSTAELEGLAAACWIEIKNQSEVVENNADFQRAKEDVKLFNSSLKEVTDPLKARLDVASLFVEKQKRNV